MQKNDKQDSKKLKKPLEFFSVSARFPNNVKFFEEENGNPAYFENKRRFHGKKQPEFVTEHFYDMENYFGIDKISEKDPFKDLPFGKILTFDVQIQTRIFGPEKRVVITYFFSKDKAKKDLKFWNYNSNSNIKMLRIPHTNRGIAVIDKDYSEKSNKNISVKKPKYSFKKGGV